MHALNRRLFLKETSAALAAAAVAGGYRQAAAGQGDAASIVPGKDPRLLVLKTAPPNFETPPALLADSQVTPTPLFFVRNTQMPPKHAGSRALAGWKIDVSGLVNRPQSFDAALLARLPQQEVEMVVQCSGNGRTIFSKSARTDGTQWDRGAMGNVRFTGVPLAAVFDKLGVEPGPKAKYLTSAGRDDPAPGEMDFEHSLPLDEVLNKSILALALNGKPLPAIHGGPVRLVTPGFYGTMQVKWVTMLRCDDRESDHTSQIPKYRTPLVPIKPGAKFEATYANSEPNWHMRLKSVVLSPAPDAQLAPGKTSVVGVAFNDGEARIDSVLVSTDRGTSWQKAELDVPQSPYAWYRWRASVKLARGKHQIWARAIDALGRSQPLDGSIYWNPLGYTYNGVEKIDVTVS